MKRYFSIAIVLVALGITLPASAQDKETSLRFAEPRAISDIIKACTEEAGLTVTGLEQLTNEMTYKGELDVRPVASVVSQLVKPFGFETVIDGTTIHIRRVSQTPPPAAQAVPTAPAGTNRSAIQARIEDLSSRYPHAYNDDGTIGSYAQLNAMNNELFVQSETARVASSRYYPQYPQAEPFFDGGYGGYSNGYGNYLNPFAIRNFSNQEKYGLLKIDGPDKFLRNVRILVDDVDVAVASKANNAWNSPVVVPAGNHVIEFVRESKDDIVAFRRNVAIQPVSVTGNNPTRLRVSGNEFENSREIYQYRQHRFIETPDGKLKPVPDPAVK